MKISGNSSRGLLAVAMVGAAHCRRCFVCRKIGMGACGKCVVVIDARPWRALVWVGAAGVLSFQWQWIGSKPWSQRKLEPRQAGASKA